MNYDPHGMGLQPSPSDDEQPPQDGIPEDALFGVLNFDTNEWTGTWLNDEDMAQDVANNVNRSGLPLIVISIDGSEYFESSGF